MQAVSKRLVYDVANLRQFGLGSEEPKQIRFNVIYSSQRFKKNSPKNFHSYISPNIGDFPLFKVQAPLLRIPCHNTFNKIASYTFFYVHHTPPITITFDALKDAFDGADFLIWPARRS